MSSPGRCLSYQEALDFLYDRINYERLADGQPGYQFRLRRTGELMKALGLADYLHHADSDSPPPAADFTDVADRSTAGPKVPLVHIAGTKGKGSTATIVSEILTAAGYRTGLYTSPHLTRLEERFRINSDPCDPQELADLVQLISPVAQELESDGHPLSFFELTTAMAMLHFDRHDCDAIVLEVGLGGRLDSTNVCASSVAAITSIGLDHQRVLGNTLAEIAGEKAGIIKSNAPVVCGRVGPEADAVIRRRASQWSAPLVQLGRDFTIEQHELLSNGSQFEISFHESLLTSKLGENRLAVRFPIEGFHQCENASLAIAIVRLLAEDGALSDEQIQRGLEQVNLIGRIEQFALKEGPTVILDTAHNVDSFEALASTLSSRRGKRFGRPLVAVFACSRDKEPTEMLHCIAPVVDHLVATQFTTNPRRMPMGELEDSLERIPMAAKSLESDPVKALNLAIELAGREGTVVVCGSFFLAGQLREYVLEQSRIDSAGLDGTSIDVSKAPPAMEAQ